MARPHQQRAQGGLQFAVQFKPNAAKEEGRFAHCGWLRFGSALRALPGFKRFPGDDAMPRFFARFTQGRAEAFFRPLFRWLIALLKQPSESFTLDLDSTVFAREGAAKGCNPRRPGRKSHHPLLAAVSGLNSSSSAMSRRISREMLKRGRHGGSS